MGHPDIVGDSSVSGRKRVADLPWELSFLSLCLSVAFHWAGHGVRCHGDTFTSRLLRIFESLQVSEYTFLERFLIAQPGEH